MRLSLVRRYLKGRASAAAIAVGSPMRGAIALCLHAFGYLLAVMAIVLALLIAVLLLLGGSDIAQGAMFAIILAGMVPTGFLMLETLRAIQVWIGGPSQAASLHARILAQLDSLGDRRND